MDKMIETSLRFLTVLPAHREWGLFAPSVGRGARRPGKDYGLRNCSGRLLDCPALVYLVAGRGWFESDGVPERPVAAGDLMLLFKNVRHRYWPDLETGWSEFWLAFDGWQVDEWLRRGVLSPRHPVWSPGVDQELTALFLEAHELAQPEGLDQYLLGGVVARILARARALVARQDRESCPRAEALRRAVRALEAEEADETDLAELAREAHLSYPHFRRLFREQTGLAPHQYRLQAKLNRAKQLLLHTTLSVKEAAVAAGFDDPLYFSRLFRKTTGISPSHWRGKS